MKTNNLDKKKRKQKQAGFEVKTFPVAFALETIKENLSIYTNNPSPPSKEQIIKEAYGFHSQGNTSEAAKYYQYFIDRGFEDHGVFSNYGIILKNLGKLKQANLYTRKAIALNPNIYKSHYLLGTILIGQKKFQEAEEALRKAIELKPDLFQAHVDLGSVLKDLGKLQEAEISTRKAIEINPNLAESHYNLGIILKDLGNLKEAEISTRKAIEINPNLSSAHLNLGIIHNDNGKNNQASNHFRQALYLNSDNHQIRYHLGFSLENEAKFENDHDLRVSLKNEAKFQFSEAFKKRKVIAKIGLLNRSPKNFNKKIIIIDQYIISLLNKLSQSINSMYGFHPNGAHAINLGPCGDFANEFFMIWNLRFINQSEICFVKSIKQNKPKHVLVKLPNSQLFDGGRGVHNFNTYNKKDDELIIMKKYDLETIDKHSWGLYQEEYRKCPNFSIRKTSDIISKYLDYIYYSLPKEKKKREHHTLSEVSEHTEA